METIRHADACPRNWQVWSARFLLATLGNRPPLSLAEMSVLLALVSLARGSLFAQDVVSAVDGDCYARYRKGIGELVRHVAVCVHGEHMEPNCHLTVDCFLGNATLHIPSWVRQVFRRVLHYQLSNRRSEDRHEFLARLSSVLGGASFRNDALEHWVDLQSPISSVVAGTWLQYYAKLPKAVGLVTASARSASGSDPFHSFCKKTIAQRLNLLANGMAAGGGNHSAFTEMDEDFLLHAIAEVAYRIGRMPRELRIARVLSLCARNELALYSLGNYRDHLYHVLNVATLGVFLSDIGLLTRDKRKLLKGNLLGRWLTAALLHDVGYMAYPGVFVNPPADLVQRLASSLRLWAGIEVAGKEELRRINDEVKTTFGIQQELGDRFDHGIISSAIVSRMVAGFPGSRDWIRRRATVQEALSGIAKHNLRNEPIDFSREPVAALLVLCDELQEWGRPRWDSEAFSRMVIGAVHFGGHRLSPGIKLCKRMRILPRNDRDSHAWATIVLEFGDPVEDSYDPWSLIISKLLALQRLSNMPLLDISLQFPACAEWKRRTVLGEDFTYRSVMRRFVSAMDHPVLAHGVLWPELREEAGARWLERDGYEEIIVALGSLSRFRPVLTTPEIFMSEFDSFLRGLTTGSGRFDVVRRIR
ncbi:MAG: hypothetical protein HZA90_01185 [Verrucomicrobia bacterium]|nr:hypothetical protein [Verrucomicrobiota bacterium]